MRTKNRNDVLQPNKETQREIGCRHMVDCRKISGRQKQRAGPLLNMQEGRKLTERMQTHGRLREEIGQTKTKGWPFGLVGLFNRGLNMPESQGRDRYV
jgi:hypothetical protein